MLNFFTNRNRNTPSMHFFVKEIDSTAQGQFTIIPDETWRVTHTCIETPHGTLKVKKYVIVREGPLVGIQFTVKGTLDLSNLSSILGKQDISTLALMRQPHNVWLWAYAFDKSNVPIVNFCGNDELDGLTHFVSEIE